ncbi:hypothetical protein I4U23_023009 [Adineta vaga]|nr:hypothetical protein I4U23_023009 [Adineta vaga]
MALRTLNSERKKYVILFLYESGLLDGSGLDLNGVDLNDVQFIGPYKLSHLYLPNVFLKNALFLKCHLYKAVFTQSYMTNASFIDSSLDSASFAESVLDNVQFVRTKAFNINFTSASLVQANFLDATFVQGNDFTNADLFQARFTKDQFEGRRVSTTPHTFSYARLPNGSFGDLNPQRNLLTNGDAERECSTRRRTNWPIDSRSADLLLIALNETFVDKTVTNYHNWGHCIFGMTIGSTRASQNIDLRHYSHLIDLKRATFSSFAYVGCNGTTDAAYVEVSTLASDPVIMENSTFLNRTTAIEDNDMMMHQYGIKEYRLLPNTRRARVSFGVRGTLAAGIFCYFDNITFSMQKH